MDASITATKLQNGNPDVENGTTYTFERCDDTLTCNLDDVQMEPSGKMLDLSTCLRNVCPGKRTALAVTLHEKDDNDVEYARGVRMMTIPAHNESCSRDILVEHIRFVLPDDNSVSSTGQRRFVARTIAHYVDSTEGDCPCAND